MKNTANKLNLSALVLCCASGIAQAQLEAPSGLHIGPYSALPPGGENRLTFGDGWVSISEDGGEDFVKHRAKQFSFLSSRAEYSGNVGIGTASPVAKLDVRGNLILDSGVDPKIYTAAAGGELNRYLRIFNSPEHESASGMKIGGLLVSEQYDYASPGKNDVIVQGTVGIGSPTINPGAKLSLHSTWGNWMELVKADAPYTKWGLHTPQASGRLEFAYHNGTDWNWGRFVLTEDGVGIGTTAPQAKLDVAGQIRSTTLLLTSDRNAKADFQSLASRDVLKKVASLPISTWQYTNAPGVRHVGPMAQDFKAAFPELGEDDKHIATVDADGVALASIQALYELVQEKDSEIAALKRQVSSLQTELAGVKDSVTDRLAALEKAMAKDVVEASFRPEAAR